MTINSLTGGWRPNISAFRSSTPRGMWIFVKDVFLSKAFWKKNILKLNIFSIELEKLKKTPNSSGYTRLKKFLDPFCFACTLGLLPCSLPLHKAKWVQLNGKTLQVLKNSLRKTYLLPSKILPSLFPLLFLSKYISRPRLNFL